MNQHQYDFVVLGGGSAGYAAARTAHDLGLKTAVIDGAETLGGLCILRGCMPSKTLIESANRNLTIRRAAEFGLRANQTEVHPREIRDRKRALINDFSSYRQGQLEDGRFDLHRGYASYIDATTIEITPHDGSTNFQITTTTSLIATGSSIWTPDLPGLEESGYLDSDDILDAETLPKSIIVLGGGPIALEMAHYLEGVGVQVTVIQRSAHVLSSMDFDIADAVEHALEERGIIIHTNTKLISAGKTSEGLKTITFERDGDTHTVEAEQILSALGRKPATEKLNAEAAGVTLEKGRVKVSPQQRSSAPNIFAAGDVCGPLEVVHLAIEQGEAAANNAAIHLGKLSTEEEKSMDYRLALFGVFTHPQAASVGLSEREAEAQGIPVHVATYPFDDHGKSMTMGETHGFVKLIANKETGEIIGGSAAGPEVVEIIHEIVVAMHFRATGADLMKIPHYHPTLSEIWTYPAEELADLAKK
jgi:pyruvate/2-oxoglutarate dehydrogenase complex dihydrolipoamide dehydrogenase (E3) component